MPKVIRAGIAAVMLGVLGALFLGWLLLLVVGGRSAVRVWSARHRPRMADR